MLALLQNVTTQHLGLRPNCLNFLQVLLATYTSSWPRPNTQLAASWHFGYQEKCDASVGQKKCGRLFSTALLLCTWAEICNSRLAGMMRGTRDLLEWTRLSVSLQVLAVSHNFLLWRGPKKRRSGASERAGGFLSIVNHWWTQSFACFLYIT